MSIPFRRAAAFRKAQLAGDPFPPPPESIGPVEVYIDAKSGRILTAGPGYLIGLPIGKLAKPRPRKNFRQLNRSNP